MADAGSPASPPGSRASAPLGPGALIANKYQLGAVLARGGMGSVWSAHDLALRRPVAIKFMAQSIAADPTYRRRFEVEARAAAQLRTAHVVQIFDFGIDDALPYIVMELLEGEDLEERLRRVHRFSLPDALHLVTQIGKALRLAHEAGIIHRDLKPGNIFLARTGDDDEVVKLLDFGIAKLHHNEGPFGPGTLSGVVLGSPAYMSPEQVKSQPIDHRSDLFSLGSILFRLLTGQRPFEGEKLEVLRAIAREPAPAPSSVAPDLPRELDAFFERALAKDPEQRFGSVRELVAELRLLAGVPVKAPDAPTTSVAVSPGDGAPPASTNATTGATVTLVRLDAPISPAKPGRLGLVFGATLVGLVAIGAGVVLATRSGSAEPPTARSTESEAAATAPPGAPSIPSAPLTAPEPAIATSAAEPSALPSATAAAGPGTASASLEGAPTSTAIAMTPRKAAPKSKVSGAPSATSKKGAKPKPDFGY